jgi:hypothetical protein
VGDLDPLRCWLDKYRPPNAAARRSERALAIKKFSKLEIDAPSRHAEIVTFAYVAERHQREVLPTKSAP